MILLGLKQTLYAAIILWLVLAVSLFQERKGKDWIVAALIALYFLLTVADLKSGLFVAGMIVILILNITKKKENFNTTNIITSLLAIITGVLFQIDGFDTPVMTILFVMIALEVFDAGMKFKESQTAENKGAILKKLIESIITIVLCLIVLYIYLL
jgi:hypothetical protein